MSLMEVNGAGWSWVEVNGAGWSWVHGLVIHFCFNSSKFLEPYIIFYFNLVKIFFLHKKLNFIIIKFNSNFFQLF